VGTVNVGVALGEEVVKVSAGEVEPFEWLNASAEFK
jgi:hypothetical protein